MKRKLLLINPIDHRRPGLSRQANTKFPPMSLGMVAAVTPKHWEVELTDENWTKFEYREADFVGITAFTSTASRAYTLAQIYRSRGIPVILGGVHPTMCPDEAALHADSVFTGEAEVIWPDVIADLENGRLQARYDGGITPALSQAPPPRQDLFNPGHLIASVHTARGCPLDCDFCSVTTVSGARHRHRPIEQVVEEIAATRQKILFFTDDNLIGHGSASVQRAIKLFQAMVDAKVNKWWFCQSALNFAENDEVLYWAKRSGCKLVFIGVEDVAEGGLKEVSKNFNLNLLPDYDRIFKKIRRSGIAVWAAFLLGFDNDTETSLRQRENFIVNGGVDVVQATIMTPLPGTRVFDRIAKEDRLIYKNFPDDWYWYDFNKVVYRPRNIEPETLAATVRRCHGRMLSLPVIFRRVVSALFTTRNLVSTGLVLTFNFSYRKIAREVWADHRRHQQEMAVQTGGQR